MVKIGYLHQYDFVKVCGLMQKYSIKPIGYIELDNEYCCIEVESEALKRYGLCCFGRYNYVYYDKSVVWDKMYQRYPEKKRERIVQLYESLKNRTMDDANMWIKFSKEFVNLFDKVILYIYYPEISHIDNGSKTISIKELSIDDLLVIENNQKLMIVK